MAFNDVHKYSSLQSLPLEREESILKDLKSFDKMNKKLLIHKIKFWLTNICERSHDAPQIYNISGIGVSSASSIIDNRLQTPPVFHQKSITYWGNYHRLYKNLYEEANNLARYKWEVAGVNRLNIAR